MFHVKHRCTTIAQRGRGSRRDATVARPSGSGGAPRDGDPHQSMALPQPRARASPSLPPGPIAGWPSPRGHSPRRRRRGCRSEMTSAQRDWRSCGSRRLGVARCHLASVPLGNGQCGRCSRRAAFGGHSPLQADQGCARAQHRPLRLWTRRVGQLRTLIVRQNSARAAASSLRTAPPLSPRREPLSRNGGCCTPPRTPIRVREREDGASGSDVRVSAG